MLDRIPAWLRHALIALGGGLLSILLPLLAQHQEDVRDWIVNSLHLPLILAPFIAAALATAILRLTTLTRQYGTGAATPPTVPVIDPNADAGTFYQPGVDAIRDQTEPDAGELGHGMAGHALNEILVTVALIAAIICACIYIGAHLH